MEPLLRARINGEVRLWVNGEEVSGGTSTATRDRLSRASNPKASPVEFRYFFAPVVSRLGLRNARVGDRGGATAGWLRCLAHLLFGS